MSSYCFKINELLFRDTDQTRFAPTGLTVFIGPNNSGKSKCLKEIRSSILGQWDNGGREKRANVILESVAINEPRSVEDIESSYGISKRISFSPENNGWHTRDHCSKGLYIDPQGAISYDISHGCYPAQGKTSLEVLRGVMAEGEGLEWGYRPISGLIGPSFVNYSGTESRLLLSIGEKRFGTADGESNFLSSIEHENEIFAVLSERTKELFNRDVILDTITRGGLIQLRTAPDFDSFRKAPRSDSSFNALIENAELLQNEGDGLRSFVSVFLSLKARLKPIVLVDEPESFLHPPHARKLGSIIGECIDSSKQIYIATHSAYLLEGIVSDRAREQDVTLVRMFRRGDDLAVRIISPEFFNEILKEPVLRGTQIISGLFSKAVILVESESDQTLFSYLLERVGYLDDIQIISLNGKHSFPKVVGFYKKIGVNVGMILDFDVFNYHDVLNGTDILRLILEAGECDRVEDYAVMRDSVSGKMASLISLVDPRNPTKTEKDEYKSYFKCNPLKLLEEEISGVANKLMDELLSEENIFVIGTGQLETVYPKVPHSANNKKSWLKRAMDELSREELAGIEGLPVVDNLKRLVKQLC